MKDRIKYLIIPILIILLILPRPAFAFLGTGIFDYFEAALNGIEEKAGPVSAFLINLFLTFVVALISANVSANLLEMVISHPEWLSITGNQMVENGWRFTAGIANMFLILIAIFIALTIILKIETFEGKKTFVRLVIAAILMNFSLVFIGILVDVANIFFNGILAGSPNLPSQVIEPLVASGMGTATNLAGWIVAMAVAFMIPFIGPFAQFGLVAVMITLTFPTFVIWFFTLSSLFLVSTLFFTYALLFGARVFIIQLLAILSPFAVLFAILPQTRKYWNEWLQHLMEWIFFGLALFLFMVVGLRASKELMPATGPYATVTVVGGNMPNYFVYYFFLFIYLVVTIWLSQKYMPTLASAVISQATSLGNMVWSKGIRPIGSAAVKELREGGRGAGALRGRILGSERWQQRADSWAKSEGRFAGGIKRWAGRGLGPGLREQEKGELVKKEVAYEKIKDPTLLSSKVRSSIENRDYTDAIAGYNQAIKKGGDFAKEIKQTLSKEERFDLGERAEKLKATPERKRIARSLIDEANEADLQRMGFKSYAQLQATDKDAAADWDAKGYKTIKDSIIGESKGDEIKELAKGFWDSKSAMEAVDQFWSGPQIRKAIDEFGASFTNAYSKNVRDTMNIINSYDKPSSSAADKAMAADLFKDYAKRNKKRALFHDTSAAQELGIESFYASAPSEIKNNYKNIKQVVAEK
jgi:hypothetical protein